MQNISAGTPAPYTGTHADLTVVDGGEGLDDDRA